MTCEHAPRVLGRRSASTFSKSFQNSRLASLPKPKPVKDWKQRQQLHNKIPTSQVIHTTPASNHRRDFGLKRSMPAPLSSRHIVANKFDTPYGFTDYGPGTKSIILKRLQSLQTAPLPIARKSPERPEISPLFFGKTEKLGSTESRNTSIESVRNDFKTWLQGKNKSLENVTEHDIHQFAQTRSKKPNFPDASPIATAGFSYSLPGVLQNTPSAARGITNQTTVPGRVLDKTGRLIAASGLISVSETGSVNVENKLKPSIHQQVYPMIVDRLRITPTAEVNMYLKHKRSATSLIEKRRLGMSKFVQNDSFNLFGGSGGADGMTSRGSNGNASHSTKNAYYDLIKKTLYS